jgi:hypothetical protein
VRSSSLLLLSGLVGVIGLSACDDHGPTVTDAARFGNDTTFVATLDPHGLLRQEIRLSPAQPRQGDTLWITSVLTSFGADVVSARTCGLDLRGPLELRDPFFRCAAYSIHRDPLAAGDSLVESDGGIVLSAPGRYELQVRHLLEPELWVRVSVTVRP